MTFLATVFFGIGMVLIASAWDNKSIVQEFLLMITGGNVFTGTSAQTQGQAA